MRSKITMAGALILAGYLGAYQASARPAEQDQKRKYSAQPAPRASADVKLDQAGKIDTSKPPMPSDDLVDVIVAHDSQCPLTADGGFFLDKTGKGYTVHQGTGIHAATELQGYGSSIDTWVYQYMAAGEKFYIAFWKNGPDEMHPYAVYISQGVPSPTDLSSFQRAGYATRGKRTP